MQPVNHIVQKIPRPVTVLQYGEGNFLRAFADYMIDIANEKNLFNGNIYIIKPIPLGSLEPLLAQDCVYTVLLRGQRGGETYTEKRIITSVSEAADPYTEYEACAALAKSPELRFVISNTTESGIAFSPTDKITDNPPDSFPAKLTKFLYERFLHFNGDETKGLIMLPVELIDKNGETLKECCLKLSELWKLPGEFAQWLSKANIFCNTLVDRIVTGYPAAEALALERELGYTDKAMVTGEPFALWVIQHESPEKIAAEFPLDKAGLPVIFTDNLKPYRERKVRILNGAHTASVPAAYLCGLDTVGAMIKDATLRRFLDAVVYDELAPMVPLPEDEVKEFAASVMERFENPFIQHNLLSIALNSVSKFKARILPSIIETQSESDSPPPLLCFSLAALIAFYGGKKDGGKLTGIRNGIPYEIVDDASVLDFFAVNANKPAEELVPVFLRREDFWGSDLTRIPGVTSSVGSSLQSIRDLGMRAAVENLLK
jgi:tagaturonate reductase